MIEAKEKDEHRDTKNTEGHREELNLGGKQAQHQEQNPGTTCLGRMECSLFLLLPYLKNLFSVNLRALCASVFLFLRILFQLLPSSIRVPSSTRTTYAFPPSSSIAAATRSGFSGAYTNMHPPPPDPFIFPPYAPAFSAAFIIRSILGVEIR